MNYAVVFSSLKFQIPRSDEEIGFNCTQYTILSFYVWLHWLQPIGIVSFVLQICRRCSLSSRNMLKFTLLCVRLLPIWNSDLRSATSELSHVSCVARPVSLSHKAPRPYLLCNKKSCRMANTRESEWGNLIKLIREVPAGVDILHPRLIIHVYIVFAEAEPPLSYRHQTFFKIRF